ncbi:LPS O-antigen chain length determinant protein WzzB [Halopseudomonas pelagia]|uniref:LPS O-antigen chain length determinant protein WzzB n=1 Tax=Halopseudomonas pelagia TaxID=553151 RepID=UPI0003B2F588|nr:Wzz/FepE/Etk N-terminal domain-containing protein [Halopseudomonas pelagia]
MTTPTTARRYSRSDEIDLFELAQQLWQQKWLMVGIAGLVILIAVAYALLATPVYQATARVMPPHAADIAPINLGRDQAEIKPLGVEEAYAIFTRNLRSQASRRWFYQELYLPYLQEQRISGTRGNLLGQKGEVLIVYVPDVRSNPDNYAVQVNLSDPERAAQLANSFIAEASRRALADLEKNTRAQVNNKRRELEEHIEALRVSANDQRRDRIARLQEALSVAEAIGLENPQVTGGSTQVTVGGSPAADTAQMSDGSMLFLNGTKAISAELALLQARKNDDPFIGPLRGLQLEIAMLNLVEPLPELAQLFTLDSAADVPENPARPNKAMIVLLGVVLGGMLASATASVCIALRRRKNRNHINARS